MLVIQSMEEERKPLWLVLEEAIAESEGDYKFYWLAFKARHPEFYAVEGIPQKPIVAPSSNL
jgi:hypothetical protein